MNSDCELPSAAALLAADVVSLEYELSNRTRDLHVTRSMLSIALEMCVELARQLAMKDARC